MPVESFRSFREHVIVATETSKLPDSVNPFTREKRLADVLATKAGIIPNNWKPGGPEELDKDWPPRPSFDPETGEIKDPYSPPERKTKPPENSQESGRTTNSSDEIETG